MSTHTMRAIRLHKHGGPEVLRYDEMPIPEPRPGEVLVRVHAVSVNPPDWYLRGGLTTMPGETESTLNLPVIPGTDVSGVVEDVAADVDGFTAGDEVFGLLRFPSFKGSAYAQYVATPASDLARKPASIDHHSTALDGTRRRHNSAHQRRRRRRGALRTAARETERRTCHRGSIRARMNRFSATSAPTGSSTTRRPAPRNSCTTSTSFSTLSAAPTANASCARSSPAAPSFPYFPGTSTKKRSRSWASRSRAPRSARTARSSPNWDACSTRDVNIPVRQLRMHRGEDSAPGPDVAHHRASRARAITMRWIWLVPS